jgi:hypothetical protein
MFAYTYVPRRASTNDELESPKTVHKHRWEVETFEIDALREFGRV